MKKGLLLPLALTAVLACATPGKKGPEKIHEDIDAAMNDGKEKVGEVMSSTKVEPHKEGSSYPRIIKPPPDLYDSEYEEQKQLEKEQKEEQEKRKQEQKEQDAQKNKAYLEAKLQQEKEAFLKRYEPEMSKTDEPLHSPAEMKKMVDKVIACVDKYDGYPADSPPIQWSSQNAWSCQILRPGTLPIASEIGTDTEHIFYCKNDLEKQLRMKNYDLYPSDKAIQIVTNERKIFGPAEGRETFFQDENADGTIDSAFENYYTGKIRGSIMTREYENVKGGGTINNIQYKLKFSSPEALAAAPMHVKNLHLEKEFIRKYGAALRKTVAYCDKLDKYEKKVSHPSGQGKKKSQ